jgi:hypothetical protein
MNERRKDNIYSANELAETMIDVADQNEKNCESDTCLLIYSILRDCGYQIKKIVETERSNHLEC